MPLLRRSVKTVGNTGLGSTTKKNKHVKRTKKNRRNKGKLIGGGVEDFGSACGGQKQANSVITKKFIADIIDKKTVGFLIEPAQFPQGEFGGSNYMNYPTGTFRLSDYYIIHTGKYYFIEKDDYDPTVPGYTDRFPITAPPPAAVAPPPAASAAAAGAVAPPAASAPPPAPPAAAAAPAVAAKIEKDVDKRNFDVYMLALKDNAMVYKGLFKLETICDGGAFSITDAPTPINTHAIIDIDGTKKSRLVGSLLDTDPAGAAAVAAPAAVTAPAAAAAAATRRARAVTARAVTAARVTTARTKADFTFNELIDAIKDKKQTQKNVVILQVKKELLRTYVTGVNNGIQEDYLVFGQLCNCNTIHCHIDGTNSIYEIKQYTTQSRNGSPGNILTNIICLLTPTTTDLADYTRNTYTIAITGNVNEPYASTIAAGSTDNVIDIPIEIQDDVLDYLHEPFNTSAVKAKVDEYTVIAQ